MRWQLAADGVSVCRAAGVVDDVVCAGCRPTSGNVDVYTADSTTMFLLSVSRSDEGENQWQRRGRLSTFGGN